MDRYTLTRAVRRFRPVKLPLAGDKRAAVCLAVFVDNDVPSIWLTERAGTLRQHPGQFALPGGRVDPAETAAEAALRELFEEIGVRAVQSQIVGELDDFRTKSGYVITPFVVWIGRFSGRLVPNDAEVAAVHTVTLDELAEPIRFVDDPDVAETILQWPFRGTFLSAPTAALLYQFSEVVVRRRTTRVSHVGQPTFAWQ